MNKNIIAASSNTLQNNYQNCTFRVNILETLLELNNKLVLEV